MPYYLDDFWKTPIDDMSDDDLWVHYYECLQRHDFTYQYSDDHGVWRAGCKKEDHLRLVRMRVELLDKEMSNLLYETYNPWMNGEISCE